MFVFCLFVCRRVTRSSTHFILGNASSSLEDIVPSVYPLVSVPGVHEGPNHMQSDNKTILNNTYINSPDSPDLHSTTAVPSNLTGLTLPAAANCCDLDLDLETDMRPASFSNSMVHTTSTISSTHSHGQTLTRSSAHGMLVHNSSSNGASSSISLPAKQVQRASGFRRLAQILSFGSFHGIDSKSNDFDEIMPEETDETEPFLNTTTNKSTEGSDPNDNDDMKESVEDKMTVVDAIERTKNDILDIECPE